MNEQRYALFGGMAYYPSGGWDDLIGCYPTDTDALSKVHEIIAGCNGSTFMVLDWWHIVDLETAVSLWSQDGHPPL